MAEAYPEYVEFTIMKRAILKTEKLLGNKFPPHKITEHTDILDGIPDDVPASTSIRVFRVEFFEDVYRFIMNNKKAGRRKNLELMEIWEDAEKKFCKHFNIDDPNLNRFADVRKKIKEQKI